MIQLCSRPSITRSIPRSIPIEHLGYLIADIAQNALPPRSAVNEGDVGVDVRPATTTPSDDLVRDDWDRFVAFFEGTMRCQDECEWELGLV